ncbi:hypothetical protein Sjap_014827 [Stephania japonica]|uniref:Pentatricopeptide repeat-containing protein n=1 Tax=Stephania japonica TaxID=461633 RepID=A0AAP0IIG6_9MAGN
MSKPRIVLHRPISKTNLIRTTKLSNHSKSPKIPNCNSITSLVAHYTSSSAFISCPQKINQNYAYPDEYTVVKALKAAPFQCPNHGQRIHAVVIKLGFFRFTVLMTALMDYTLKCGELEDAEKVFDEMPDRDVVSWTSMIVGHVKHQCYAKSINLFGAMVCEGGTAPSVYTFSGALGACSGLQALKQGQQIHAHVLASGCLGDDSLVLQNNLLDMYSRSRRINDARKLFNSMAVKGNIAWNEMMSGYLLCGDEEEGFKLFASMVSQGVKPDKFSCAIGTDACAGLASIQQGIQIHAYIVKAGFHRDLVIGNGLVDMYAKCGCVEDAKLIFDAMPSADAFLWTTMISAYGKNGQFREVLTMFELMLGSNIKPDEITFLIVLSACSHGGLIDLGYRYFRLMTEQHMLTLLPEHYACMVDLLCRGGYLLEALEFIKQMPFKPNISVWTSFLSSCRMYGNVELAQFAADQLIELNPGNQTDIIVLSNIYAAGHDWDESEKIRERMRSDNVKKDPGCSWIELKNGIHVFFTGERLQPLIGEISLSLNGLMYTFWEEELAC